MSELPQHLKYRPSPEIVRAHEQWQAASRAAASQLQSMGHVRAPEAISQTMLPLMVHLDTLFTVLQADLSSYAEQVMLLSHAAKNSDDNVIVGLHPDDADTLAEQIDDVSGLVAKVAKGLKEGSDQRKDLDKACTWLDELQEAVGSIALDDDDVSVDDADADDGNDAEMETAPTASEASPPVAADDEPALQIL